MKYYVQCYLPNYPKGWFELRKESVIRKLGSNFDTLVNKGFFKTTEKMFATSTWLRQPVHVLLT